MDEAVSEVPETAAGVNMPARWFVDPMGVPSPVNALLVQVGAPAGESVDSVYLTFGHVNPPLVEGPGPGIPLTPEMVEGVVLPVTAVARVTLSPDRLAGFRDQINLVLDAINGASE